MEVSPLGLVEMTRQNVTDGVREILTKRVPDLRRRGRRAIGGDGRDRGRPQAARARRRASRRPGGVPDPGQPAGRGRAARARTAALLELEEETGKHFHFEGGEALPLDTYEVVDRGTRAEIEERALPFQVGEEVLVTIEEPHMYNADDAIARVDSYIVSVGGGGAHVGERRLVRIESVGRSAATAALLGEPTGDGDREAESPTARPTRVP